LQWEILMDREHLEGLRIDGNIILKYMTTNRWEHNIKVHLKEI
jgi:hypothetical protein